MKGFEKYEFAIDSRHRIILACSREFQEIIMQEYMNSRRLNETELVEIIKDKEVDGRSGAECDDIKEAAAGIGICLYDNRLLLKDMVYEKGHRMMSVLKELDWRLKFEKAASGVRLSGRRVEFEELGDFSGRSEPGELGNPDDSGRISEPSGPINIGAFDWLSETGSGDGSADESVPSDSSAQIRASGNPGAGAGFGIYYEDDLAGHKRERIKAKLFGGRRSRG